MQEFVIQSMSCGGCASRIAQAVKNLDAKAKTEVDLATKTLRIDRTEDRASVPDCRPDESGLCAEVTLPVENSNEPYAIQPA